MASRKSLGYLVGVSLLALATSAATAKAATLVGLTADNKLVKIDTATMAASAPMAISSADKVLGIDVRPADGKLYGLTATGQLVVIDPMNGATTAGSTLSEKAPLGSRPWRLPHWWPAPAATRRRDIRVFSGKPSVSSSPEASFVRRGEIALRMTRLTRS